MEKSNAFREFLKEIIKGNAKKCANMIYQISEMSGKVLGSSESPSNP
jgi:hypothetical protein